MKRIAVVGDVMLDEFVTGDVERISPEAPVPVYRCKSRFYRLGGAAHVAHSIEALGGSCTLVGKGIADADFTACASSAGIDYTLLPDNFPVIRKTRFLANNQQLLRVDDEHLSDLDESLHERVLQLVQDHEVLVISDYLKGMISDNLLARLMSLNVTTIVDPKSPQAHRYKGATVITPNVREAFAMALHLGPKCESIIDVGHLLQQTLNCSVLVTRGAEGMTLFDGGPAFHVPTVAKEVFDITGAGDTVVAALAVCLAEGKTIRESIPITNKAAGIAVGKLATSVVEKWELEQSLSKSGSPHVIPLIHLSTQIDRLRSNGKRIVFTNGFFDVLHIGHLELLKRAKQFGDVLVVGLNSDDSARRLKGPTRPIHSSDERAAIVASLAPVDYVTVFEEDTPSETIRRLKPDVHVKGGDYELSPESLPESSVVESYGGRIEIVPLLADHSTTKILERIKNEI